MPRIEPALVPVVSDLARGLRDLGVPFGVVGALVPELLLDARPARMTNDADVAVVVATLDDFESLKDRLADYGFARTRLPHRMQHRSGGLVDMLPFSESIAPNGRLQLQEGFVLNMAGFRHVVSNTVATTIDGGPTLPLAPLALYALLKLVAFDDRKAPKDLGGSLPLLPALP
jgi:predicted nucleotidyltransferase